MSPEVSILLGNLTRGILLVMVVIGAGMILAALRKYYSTKERKVGLLGPTFVYPISLGLFFMDLWMINGIVESVGMAFTIGIALAIIFAIIQIYALSIVLHGDTVIERPPLNDEVDVIAMLVDRSMEKDRMLRITIFVMFGILSVVLAFLIYFSVINFARLFTLMEENRDALQLLS